MALPETKAGGASWELFLNTRLRPIRVGVRSNMDCLGLGLYCHCLQTSEERKLDRIEDKRDNKLDKFREEKSE